MKPKVTILIATAIIASILVAGCTAQSSSNQNASPSPSGPDKVVQAVIADDIQAYVNATWTLQVRNSTQWLNDTTAMVTYTIGILNGTFHYTAKYQKFDSASQASTYVASINQNYSETNAQELVNLPPLTPASSLNTHQNYQKVTNSAPTTTSYVRLLGENPIDADYIIQVNEVVITYHATFPINSQATSSAT